MGVDLRVITGHRLTAAAVLDFGSTLIDEILEMVRVKFGFKHLSDMTDQWFDHFAFYIHTVKY